MAVLTHIPKPLVPRFRMTQTAEKTIDGVLLLKSICNKESAPEEARNSFTLFVSYFEDKLKKYAEVQASHLGYSVNVAFEAIQCTFAKVWKYPYSFSMDRASCKNTENAIIIWLKKIVASQMFDYVKKGICTQQSREEDLSVIETSEEFVDYHIRDYPIEEKLILIQAMNQKISSLDEKHRIIYLTYKAYETQGKKLPRRLLEKLRVRLGVTQVTIRVYKREAYKAVGDNLEN